MELSTAQDRSHIGDIEEFAHRLPIHALQLTLGLHGSVGLLCRTPLTVFRAVQLGKRCLEVLYSFGEQGGHLSGRRIGWELHRLGFAHRVFGAVHDSIEFEGQLEEVLRLQWRGEGLADGVDERSPGVVAIMLGSAYVVSSR
ncbi:MAG: hypothetical protein ACKOYQ_10590, partial [Actinomycetota bacterium]